MNIFLMHRDFRIKDNVGLMKLLEKGSKVYLFFIFSQKQLEDNLCFNHNAFNYMVSALKQLNKKVHINFFKDKSEVELFQKIHKAEKIQRIYTNFDYTPFSISRGKELANFCSKNNIEYKEHFDYLLFQPGSIVKSDNSEYKIFKYFYQKCLLNYQKISKPLTIKFHALKLKSHHLFNISDIRTTNIDIPYKRESVIKTIENVNLTSYAQRDYWYKDTNNLSASIKFGIVSCREIVHFFKKSKKVKNPLANIFMRQFIWREFYYHLYYLRWLRSGYVFGDNYLKQFNKYEWENDPEKLQKWKKGETGFPLVDAAMKLLNKTGKMHNRLRMVVASFLIKNLNVHWRHGEKHFAQKLIDYDPIVNQASWQWVAGTGLESNPFFRIFSIPRQEKKFDPQRIFIKKNIDLAKYKTPEIISLNDSRLKTLEKYKKLTKS